MKMGKYLRLKVHAKAREDKLTVKGADRFEIWVREPAEAGRANRVALGLLATHLQVSVGRLWIVKGTREPSKIIVVRDLSA